jgi:hypothetical protein
MNHDRNPLNPDLLIREFICTTLLILIWAAAQILLVHKRMALIRNLQWALVATVIVIALGVLAICYCRSRRTETCCPPVATTGIDVSLAPYVSISVSGTPVTATLLPDNFQNSATLAAFAAAITVSGTTFKFDFEKIFAVVPHLTDTSLAIPALAYSAINLTTPGASTFSVNSVAAGITVPVPVFGNPYLTDLTTLNFGVPLPAMSDTNYTVTVTSDAATVAAFLAKKMVIGITLA